jgi:hypothetical protein
VKKILLVALVVLLVVIGLPVMMPGMGVAHCDDCAPTVAAGALCLLAVLGGVASLVLLASGSLRLRGRLTRTLLRTTLLDRPPQLA